MGSEQPDVCFWHLADIRGSRPAPSVALYVTLDDRMNVLPLNDLSGVIRQREFIALIGGAAAWPLAIIHS